MNSKYFYQDKPIFGLDIGFSTIKVMQAEQVDKDKYKTTGYGIIGFDPSAMKDGVIVDHKKMAESAYNLFKNNIVGEINTKRVALSVPAARTYARTITLPKVDQEDVNEAVKIEAEQYIPIPIENLYLDYVTINSTDTNTEVLAVAAPKKIIDSYIQLTQILGLEAISFDTSILAAARLFERQDEHNDIPAILVDFGSMSTDITVYDKGVILTGTVSSGGDMFTSSIANALNVSEEEAHIIKTKYGMSKSKKQVDIVNALKPSVDQMAKEIQRMIRYHEERSMSKQKIGQIISMGGGANLPGLSDYLTDIIRLPVRTAEPLKNFNLNKLRSPSPLERSMYVTVAGLSLIKPGELFSA